MTTRPLDDVRICFVGDSFVNGAGDQECLGWTGRVCASASKLGHRITYYNLGIRRETSSDIRLRWEREVSARLPQGMDARVVFSFGVNDTTLEDGKPRVDSETSVSNLRAILTEASLLYPTLMIGPPPTADEGQNVRIAELSSRYAPICDSLQVPFFDVFTLLSDIPVWKKEASEYDGSHPRSAGYAEMASIVEGWSVWTDWFAS